MKRVILHHSLTKDGEVKDFDAIKRYHIGLGWGDIGYHYVIEMVGDKPKTFKGRDESVKGAHTYGQNDNTIGICIIGNYDAIGPRSDLLLELYDLLDDIKLRYGSIQIEGHCDHPHPTKGYRKTCPGTKFPLNHIKSMYTPHWADESYTYLTQNWVDSLEKRYDEPITRGEIFSLLTRILNRLTKLWFE